MIPERRVAHRLLDILEAIDDVESALEGETFETFAAHRIKRPAVERYLEIISEASRHIPASVKDREPTIPWRKMADFGNRLRHDYHRTNAEILWDICRNHLLSLKTAARLAQKEFPDVENG